MSVSLQNALFLMSFDSSRRDASIDMKIEPYCREKMVFPVRGMLHGLHHFGSFLNIFGLLSRHDLYVFVR